MKKHICTVCPDCERFLGTNSVAKKQQSGTITQHCPDCNYPPERFKKKQYHFCEFCTTRSDNPHDVERCELVHKTDHVLELEVTQDHLTLIKNFNVKFDQHCEYGAGYIDPKRPYGNSNVDRDIGKLLGIEPKGDVYDKDDEREHREFTQEQTAYFWKLHVEAALALKICCQTQSFDPGIYVREHKFGIWQKKE